MTWKSHVHALCGSKISTTSAVYLNAGVFRFRVGSSMHASPLVTQLQRCAPGKLYLIERHAKDTADPVRFRSLYLTRAVTLRSKQCWNWSSFQQHSFCCHTSPVS